MQLHNENPATLAVEVTMDGAFIRRALVANPLHDPRITELMEALAGVLSECHLAGLESHHVRYAEVILTKLRRAERRYAGDL